MGTGNRTQWKIYWYVAITHDSTHRGKSAGCVAEVTYRAIHKDGRGSYIITNDMTTEVKISWTTLIPVFLLMILDRLILGQHHTTPCKS
jgi:hypothetical protein